MSRNASKRRKKNVLQSSMICLMKKRVMKKRIVLNDYDGKVIIRVRK